jgi:hypothetical protein
MRTILVAVFLVLVGLGTTDLVATILEARGTQPLDPALAADPGLTPAPPPVREQE